MSEQALRLIKEAKENRLTRLDLKNCGLTKLPNELLELSWLKHLILDDNKKLSDISLLENFQLLENLSISFTEVSNLVPLENLKGLRKLSFSATNVIDLRPLKYLYNLEGLDFYSTPVSDLTPLQGLQNLKGLSFAITNVSNLIPLSSLNNLQRLYAFHTKIKNLEPLSGLLNLQRLDVYQTEINELSPISKLPSLKILNIHNTPIRNLDPLSELFSLEELYVYQTQINDLEPLRNLRNLKRINISNTGVKDLKPLEGVSNLQQVEIKSTEIKDLKPLKSHFIKNDFKVNCENCSLNNPPMHIVIQGNEAILRYWEEIENKTNTINNQTKLIFVGNSRTGKTSIWCFLRDKIFDKHIDSTHGIKTEIWYNKATNLEENQKLATHIWDFGGQEYYHATHRIFLSENAVYVLVWEKGSNKQGTRLEKFKLDDDPKAEIEEVELEHFPASYWLENIQYFAGKHCPVLIVQNKVDSDTQYALYTEGGHETADCFHLSVQNAFAFQQGNEAFEESNMDFQRFKLRLLKELRKNATAFKLVKYYSQVREVLEIRAKDNEYIAVTELKDIALQFDKTPDLQNLLAYLKSFTNTVLYFPQNDVLKDRLYLNPTHISRDIYKILNKQVREKNGKFDLAHIKTRLNLTNDQEAERFVALMREFDLIFEKSKTIKGETQRQFITPQYLPKKEDLSDDMSFLIEGYAFETAFTIQFKSFVPRSLMLRFIAKKGELANQEMYWRNGIIYKSPTTQSMIKVEYDHEALTFTICVQDKSKQTVDMQNIVEQFVTLENSDDNIKISNDGKLYVELRTIRKLQHETRGGDIYENGELIPLSKFDWLTQKQETEESMTLHNEERVQNLQDILKAKKHLAQQFSDFLVKGLSYQDVWRFWISDSNIMYEALISDFFKNGRQSISYSPTLGIDYIMKKFGIDKSYPMKRWQKIFLDLIIDEYNKYHHDIYNYSFDLSILERDKSSVPESINDNSDNIPLYKLNQKNKTEESMTLEQLKEKVHDFISKAKTKEAMEAIVTWAHENNRKQLKDDINLMKGELTALDRQDTLGLLSFQEIAREKAKLNNRLLSLMNGIDINMTDNNKNSFDFDEIDEKIILTLFSFPFDPDVSTLIAKLENEGVSNNEFHKRIPLLRQKKIAEIKRDSSRTDNTVIQMHQFDNAIDYINSKKLIVITNNDKIKNDNTNKEIKPLSVFISYSKRDNELREELNIHLASLRRRNKATNWDDRHIIGGELWDETIKTKLKEADIILFLVSASFIATDYIWDYEIPMAEEQRLNGKARVIPIILKPCDWTNLDFAKQMALPSKGIPINSFLDRDTAWLEVVKGIEKVINDVLK